MNIYILLILAVLIAMHFVYNKENIYNSVKEGMTPTEESRNGRCGPDHNHTYCSSGTYCSNHGYCGITRNHKTQFNNYGYDAPDVLRKYKHVLDGKCGGKDLLMYEGSDDNSGNTLQKRLDACYTACKTNKKPLNNGSWDGFTAAGFAMKEDGRCYCEEDPSDTCERIENDYKRYDFLQKVKLPDESNHSLQRRAQEEALMQQRKSENTQLATNNQTTNEQDKVGAVSTSMDTCLANCSAPLKASGKCEGAPDGNDRRGYNDNPIIDADGSYYKKCDNICLTPGMDGYVEKMPTDGTPYNPLVHGCRTSAQCKSCGKVRVNIPKDSGKWVKEERGGVEKMYWEPKNTATSAVGYANQNLSECEMKRMQGFHNDLCPADVWTPEERKRKLAATYQSYDEDNDETPKVKPKHASDTDTGNMFLDVTNPNHTGEKDLSLEDYYRRQILNKYSENRLGGTKSAYTEMYKPDKGLKKPQYYDSVWKVF